MRDGHDWRTPADPDAIAGFQTAYQTFICASHIDPLQALSSDFGLFWHAVTYANTHQQMYTCADITCGERYYRWPLKESA